MYTGFNMEKLKNADWKAVWETVKFLVRITTLALPLVADWLLQLGLTQQAATVSALLVTIDKLIHEVKTGKFADFRGLLPF